MDVRTVLYAGSLAEIHGLWSDPARAAPALERLLDAFDVMPEEREVERQRLREALCEGKFYEGRGERGRKVLDRMIVKLLLEELPLTALTPGYQAYRFEWVLAFMERTAVARAVMDHWYRLAHGRRFGTASGEPEMVPYYGWLDAAEVSVVASALPGLLETMEAERTTWAGRPWRSLGRRGSAHDAAYWLVKDLVPVLADVARSGADVVALTGAFRGVARVREVMS